ncbi:glutathione peroxidase [Spongiimicrobium salis]|uniref:glutathione peroxidase n=1 Tax=Spongiimicrobium salis TaxID=1667022 RepID=UPI00374DF0F3
MRLLKTIKTSKKIKNSKLSKESLYGITINDSNGIPLNLQDYAGKYILFVNVASQCGFTKQYRELQILHEKYADRITLLGIPCNQFGGQEPGEPEEIQSFCQRNFGVGFSITEKIAVKGKQQHPLYTWLTQKKKNGKLNSTVRWNFQKYLVDPEGELVHVFYSITKPTSTKITRFLKERERST